MTSVRGNTCAALAAILLAGCSYMPASVNKMVGYGLTGDQEVPPVKTKAIGKSTIKIADDRTVSGGVTVDGMVPTMAHIHHGAPGVNGPIILPLVRTGDNSFGVTSSARLSPAQYEAFKAGDLYVNVHSAAHPGGEVRMQLKP